MTRRHPQLWLMLALLAAAVLLRAAFNEDDYVVRSMVMLVAAWISADSLHLYRKRTS